MPGGCFGFLNHQQYELFPCPEKDFTVFVDLCASFDSGMTRKKTSGMPGQHIFGRSEKGYLSPQNTFSVIILRLSHEFSWKMNYSKFYVDRQSYKGFLPKNVHVILEADQPFF